MDRDRIGSGLAPGDGHGGDRRNARRPGIAIFLIPVTFYVVERLATGRKSAAAEKAAPTRCSAGHGFLRGFSHGHHNRYRTAALSGLFGSLLGGSASVATAWVTQRTLKKCEEFRAEFTRRETLYGQFINECAARALDSFENTLDKSERLLSIYALLNRIRLCASDAVLAEAERALAAITEQYVQAESFARTTARVDSRWRQR